MNETYDVVVIGGGAAGLSGALALARARRSVLVVDGGQPRNAPAGHVHNYLTRDGMPPAELVAAGRDEVIRYGGEVVTGRVETVEKEGDGFLVRLDDGRGVAARRLLVTTGLVDEMPDVPGLAGSGVTCCTARTATGGRSEIGASVSWPPDRWRCTRRSCGGSGART
jgi:thioredoxin reductase